MADDDIERLLREIQQASGGAVEPVQESTKGSRLGFAALAAIGSGVAGAAGGLLLWFLPFVGPVTTSIGAALGGFITALIAGPPRWFTR